MNKNDDSIDSIISEIESLQSDLEAFEKGIEKIEEAPKEKGAEEVDVKHGELVKNLKDISQSVRELPNKWRGSQENQENKEPRDRE